MATQQLSQQAEEAVVDPSPREVKSLISSMQCQYQQHDCKQQKLSGYSYCIRHILEDKNAPFKQCNYVYPGNGRRCVMPMPKNEKRDFGYCAEHSRKTQLARQKSTRRHLPPSTHESMLFALRHHTRPDENKTDTQSSPPLDIDEQFYMDEESSDPKVVTKTLNPFVALDARNINANVSHILDYASDSDSDVEGATMEDTWAGEEMSSSDPESIDSADADPLKYAGVYTAEEVTDILREKLQRLQNLYIGQFQHLQRVLKEKRRRYLIALKKEKETFSSIHNQPRETLQEQKLYEKLCALNHYHRHVGLEAVLHKKALERRALATEGLTVKPPPISKCIFTEGGVKCGERTLPVAKHCRKHILQDAHQVLFRPCGSKEADMVCSEPVFNIFDNTLCIYHSIMPSGSQSNYLAKSKEQTLMSQHSVLHKESLSSTNADFMDGMHRQWKITDKMKIEGDSTVNSETVEKTGSDCASEAATDVGSLDTTLTAVSDMDEL